VFKIIQIPESEWSDVHEVLLKWSKQEETENILVSSLLLVNNADKQFLCTTGWIERCELPHTSCEKVSGEAGALSCEMTAQCHNKIWVRVREGYSGNDICNVYETNIFRRLTLDRALKFKRQKCADGKIPKDRIAVFV
jgi:hypothetical protein